MAPRRAAAAANTAGGSLGMAARPGADPAGLRGAARAARQRAARPGGGAAGGGAGLRRPRPAGDPHPSRQRAVRLLVLYLRSRRVPAALAAAVGSAAVLWWFAHATDDPRARATLALVAVVAGSAAAAAGLAGADVDLDRTAALAWPPRRAAHVIAAGAAVAGIVAAAALTGD